MIIDERNEQDRESMLEDAASQEEPLFYEQEKPLDEEMVSKNRKSKIETFKDGLIIEFLISSIILWSFVLFMAYGLYQKEIGICKEILSKPSQIMIVNELQEQVSEAIKKLID